MTFLSSAMFPYLCGESLFFRTGIDIRPAIRKEEREREREMRMINSHFLPSEKEKKKRRRRKVAAISLSLVDRCSRPPGPRSVLTHD